MTENATPSSTYKQDIERIQDIVQKLNDKDCDIDQMLIYVNEATELIAKCQEKLARTGVLVEDALNRLKSTGNV